MPTIECRHPSGFRVTFDVEPDGLEPCIAWLLGHGYTPDPPSGDQWRKTPNGQPICAKHNIEMKQRQKQGDEWWSHRVIHPETGQELFCRGYRNPTSAVDGYHV